MNRPGSRSIVRSNHRSGRVTGKSDNLPVIHDPLQESVASPRWAAARSETSRGAEGEAGRACGDMCA